MPARSEGQPVSDAELQSIDLAVEVAKNRLFRELDGFPLEAIAAETVETSLERNGRQLAGWMGFTPIESVVFGPCFAREVITTGIDQYMQIEQQKEGFFYRIGRSVSQARIDAIQQRLTISEQNLDRTLFLLPTADPAVSDQQLDQWYSAIKIGASSIGPLFCHLTDATFAKKQVQSAAVNVAKYRFRSPVLDEFIRLLQANKQASTP